MVLYISVSQFKNRETHGNFYLQLLDVFNTITMACSVCISPSSFNCDMMYIVLLQTRQVNHEGLQQDPVAPCGEICQCQTVYK